MPMLNELAGMDWNFGFMPYGKLWKDHRTVFAKEMNPIAYKHHRAQQYEAGCSLLRRLLDTPENFMGHLRFMASSLVMSTGYAITIKDEHDPYVEIAERTLPAQSSAGISARYWVDLWPILKYVPSWAPGAGFKREAKEWRKWVTAMPEVAFRATKKGIVEGSAASSIVSRLLDRISEDEDYVYQEHLIRGCAGTMIAAGSDTTVSVLGTFLLAMTLHPEIQKKAQKAMDNVTSGERLPDFSDYESIPYIDAVMKEVHRWHGVNPLGLPHRLMQDDEYNGYHLPTGSVVFANIWEMQHDPTLFPEPYEFKPDRFMNADGSLNVALAKDSEIAFGFGRRACPGREMANAQVWMMMALILSSFDIRPAEDGNGKPIIPVADYHWGMLTFPKEFQCLICPRSPKSVELIRAHSTAL
ncbi:hypothetical protein HGRIS_000689 [Hohenbuehelia grisea]